MRTRNIVGISVLGLSAAFAVATYQISHTPRDYSKVKSNGYICWKNDFDGSRSFRAAEAHGKKLDLWKGYRHVESSKLASADKATAAAKTFCETAVAPDGRVYGPVGP